MELSLSELRRAVEAQCRRRNCAYALLFGSVARGEARPYSDVDVAVKFRERLSPVEYAMETADMALCLEEELGVSVDVVAINAADSLLKYEVFSSGVLLYCEDLDEYVDDLINSVDEWLDFSYHFNKFYERVLSEMRDAVAGREG